MASGHCENVSEARTLGQFWENNFCVVASRFNKSFTAHQIGRREAANAIRYQNGKYHPLLLPDVTIWSAPGEHHEVKHKAPTPKDTFGLEEYRLIALKWFADETQQDVYYTIHNHQLAGGRDIKSNKYEHWVTALVNDLWLATKTGVAYRREHHASIRAGEKSPNTPQWFWPVSMWRPLVSVWKEEEMVF